MNKKHVINPILHLNLTAKWFEMVRFKIKPEEYREEKPYWDRIFGTGKIKIKGEYYNPKDVVICFSNGYRRNRLQMFIQCDGLQKREGNQEWGAEPGIIYYTLLLKF